MKTDDDIAQFVAGALMSLVLINSEILGSALFLLIEMITRIEPDQPGETRAHV
ncbi:hypothetical protein [Pseudomonas oryzihabitans]|uniref:hypothetical protein n=1 Tax=Pseudomonas oryzihabitans TaxID=47885 RepID=UPI00286745EC|nr:hypothetical protein [Pseudomonas psychrotolerans]MDR6679888.1 hypothetical protein [Pseudomonas psychrotolerans]